MPSMVPNECLDDKDVMDGRFRLMGASVFNAAKGQSFRGVWCLERFLLTCARVDHVPGSINSHYFHIIGDGHKPKSRGLYTNYKDSYGTHKKSQPQNKTFIYCKLSQLFV